MGRLSWDDYPELLADLNLEKNQNFIHYGKKISVLELSPGTNKKLCWICKQCGKDWYASGKSRIRNETKKGRGGPRKVCIECARTNWGEKRISNLIKSNGSMAETHPELAEEYDGDATKVIAGTAKLLSWTCKTCSNKWKTTGNKRTSMQSGCPYCNVGALHSDGRNSMANTYPELVAELHPTKNSGIDPDKMVAGSHQILEWQCLECGYEWSQRSSVRVSLKSGCPPCGAEKARVNLLRSNLKKTGSMSETHPFLASEFIGDPTEIIAGTHERLDWKCNVCDFEWTASGESRKRGNGCPNCAETGFKPDMPGYCYLLRYEFPDGDIKYKQGISHNINQRVSRLRRKVELAIPGTKVSIVDDVFFQVGQDAIDLENKFKELEKIRWVPKIKFEGFTEMYYPEIIPFWEKFTPQTNHKSL